MLQVQGASRCLGGIPAIDLVGLSHVFVWGRVILAYFESYVLVRLCRVIATAVILRSSRAVQVASKYPDEFLLREQCSPHCSAEAVSLSYIIFFTVPILCLWMSVCLLSICSVSFVLGG